jgi:NADPH2 dehydrogenase
VQIPVIGVGGIETGNYIDESLQAGRFMLASVGRAILKDPKAWNQNNLLCHESGNHPPSIQLVSG